MSWFDDYSHILQRDYNIRNLSSFKIGGTADWYGAPATREELISLYRAAQSDKVRIFVLGGGYNLLAPDKVDGLVLSTAKIDNIEFDEEYLHVDCGVSNARLVASAAAKGLSGLQCLAGIPGSLGGSIAMNAGGQFGEIADTVREVDLINSDGDIEKRYHSDIDFGYRHSGLTDCLIVKAILKLRPVSDRLEIKDETRRIRQLKLQSQPLGSKSAGCIFRNPTGESAGQLIDAAGLKNTRVGDAVVSEQHANFIINEGDASYDDVLTLIRLLQHKVKEQSGIELQLEVKLWGPTENA